MLALERKEGERILIGDNIVVQVVTIGRHVVKLAVVAPPDVSVDREEVRRAKRGLAPNRVKRCEYVGRSEA